MVLVEHQADSDSAFLGSFERAKDCGRRSCVKPKVIDRDLESFRCAVQEAGDPLCDCVCALATIGQEIEV
jgi:hypothetical protein